MPPPGRAAARNMVTLLALGFLLLCSMGLLALVALVMPQALGLVLVGGGFFVLCCMHYLVWGWWLSSLKPPSEAGSTSPGEPAD